VRFADWAAVNVREQQWHPSQRIVKDGRTGLVARFRLSDTRELKRWLLGYGRHAVVTKPKTLRDEMRDELCAACENYGAKAANAAKAHACRA